MRLNRAHPFRMPSPIHLHTVADLLARNHTLQLYCLRCDRWRLAPLERLVDSGLGAASIRTLKFRCAHCGTPAQLQLRPPELPPPSATGWMEIRETSP
jgi:hypothetical protein